MELAGSRNRNCMCSPAPAGHCPKRPSFKRGIRNTPGHALLCCWEVPWVSVVAVVDGSPGVCIGLCSTARSQAVDGGAGCAVPAEPRPAMGTSRDLSPERWDERTWHMWAVTQVTGVTLVLPGGTCSLGSCSPPLRSAAGSLSLFALLVAAAAPAFSLLG